MVPITKSPHRTGSPADEETRPKERDAELLETDTQVEMPLPSNLQTFILGGLFALGAFAAIYVASSIVLPVILAFILKLLQPAVRVLEDLHIPRAVGALVPILLVIGALVGLVAGLSGPAATWAERLPQGIPRLQTHLVILKGPIEALQKVIQRAEHVADTPGEKGSTIAVRHDLGLTGALFSGTGAILDGLLTTVLVLYFLMVSGDTFPSTDGRNPAEIS